MVLALSVDTMSNMKRRTFPKDFLWGASTAAHQVEGNTHNQWSEWENASAKRLAATAEKRQGWLPDWQKIKTDAQNPENYISGRAVEHYSRYKDDFQLLKQLNMNAFRFSIEWSRIEPEEGIWDEREIEHYRKYLQELKRQGIEPVVTLWHWTVPTWFIAKGDFERRKNIYYFERFIEKIITELGSEFKFVAILNEPSTYVSTGYITNERPPERHNIPLGLWSYVNLTIAHKRGYKVIKKLQPNMQVLIVQTLATIRPVHAKNPFDRMVAGFARYCLDWWFLDRIRNYTDIIGVNYYFAAYVNWRFQQRNPEKPLNDLGWYMEPEALEELLRLTQRRYGKPAIITENGVADMTDEKRQWWLERTIPALQSAIEHGVDLRGYLHWSLLDNFEWESGWWPKFGLVAVDRKTMKRSIRPSARWLGEYIRQERK